MKNTKRTFIFGLIEDMKHDLAAVSRLTASLAERLEATEADYTAADLFAVETIAEAFRSVMSSPAVMLAMGNLTASGILDKTELLAAVDRATEDEVAAAEEMRRSARADAEMEMRRGKSASTAEEEVTK